jgi:hypothetical protein
MRGHVNERPHGLRQLAPRYAACYVLWFGFCALTVLTLLQLRNAVLSLLPVIGPWVMMGVDKFSFLILGLVALIWMLFIEHYLRTGVELGVFWRRTLRIGVVHAAMLGFAYLLQFLFLMLW